MKLKLVAASPDVETVIATAMLTTCSQEGPAEIFRELKGRPEKVGKLLRGLILKHGSVIEHNRFIFLAEGSEAEMLELLLASRFIEVSRLGEGRWLLSCNARTIIELLTGHQNLPPGVREAFSEALRRAAPTLWEKVVGRGG